MVSVPETETEPAQVGHGETNSNGPSNKDGFFLRRWAWSGAAELKYAPVQKSKNMQRHLHKVVHGKNNNNMDSHSYKDVHDENKK